MNYTMNTLIVVYLIVLSNHLSIDIRVVKDLKDYLLQPSHFTDEKM